MFGQYKIFFIIFLCSFSSLAYEIALTRIFSISLWYHFAFMIISIAMLGIGASGTVLSLYPGLKNPSNTGIYTLCVGAGIFLSYLITNQIPFDPVKLSWSKIQILFIGIYYIMLSIPFFFTGLIVATAFASFKDKPAMIYGADLIGAGMGSMGFLYLMTLAAPENAVLIFSSTALLATLISGGKKLKTISVFFLLLNLAFFIINPSFINLNISPYKGLNTALKYPGAEHLETYYSPYSRIDTFKSPHVRFAPGLSLSYLDPLPEQVGFSVDGGEINAITYSGEQTSLKFLKYLPSALPYEIGNPPEFQHTPLWKRDNPPESSFSEDGLEENSKEEIGGFSMRKGDVLIVDPKGGLQILVAQFYNFSNIYRIESNPLLIKVINKDFSEFSGGIYSANTMAGIGRAWLKNIGEEFDIIDIPLTGASPSGTFGISEDYRFTVEAFKEYINHLKNDGILSINLFILPPPRTELRILNTAVTAMEELGIKDAEKHVAAIRSWGTVCILIKKSVFSSDEIEIIKKFSENLWFDLVYYPGIGEDETNIYVKMPSNDYFHSFTNILYHDKRMEFIDSYIFDIRPVRDDKPFFNYYLKLKNIREIYSIMGRKWQFFIEEGYILPVAFIQVFFLSLILIFLPAFSRNKTINTPFSKGETVGFGRRKWLFLPYFAFLGTGFMFVEVSMVHKMIMPLENPSYALATVLTSVLISSGTGSFLSYKFQYLRSHFTPLLISFFVIIYSIFLSGVSDMISQHSIFVRIFLVCLILSPPGLLMGIPFPLGIKILSEKNELLIPWAWAINGCFSVLAPILTIMIAMAFGFKTVFWLGAFSYLMAFIFLRNSYKNYG